MTKSWLDTLDNEEYLQLQMNFSSRTSSLDFQKALEDNIDKRIGRVYGPPSGKILKVFLDDLNMPTVSKCMSTTVLKTLWAVLWLYTVSRGSPLGFSIVFQRTDTAFCVGWHLRYSAAYSSAQICDGKDVLLWTRQRPWEDYLEGCAFSRGNESSRKWPKFCWPKSYFTVLLLQHPVPISRVSQANTVYYSRFEVWLWLYSA